MSVPRVASVWCLAFVLTIPCRGGQPTVAIDGTPEWIWSTVRPADQPGQGEVSFRSPVFSLGSIQAARLKCAADFCRVEIHVNGDPVRILENYAPSIDIDVTRALQRGDNLIELHCIDEEGPSAVALSLRGMTVDGQQVDVVTGGHWQASRRHTTERQNWHAVETLGTVAWTEWRDSARSIEVSPFDDYEQWRRALGTSSDADSPLIDIVDGFEITRFYKARPQEGSWVSMAIDAQGRIVVAREDQGLLRLNLTSDRTSIDSVEVVDESLQECRGLLFAYGDLYANANNSKGLYRLRDEDNDGRFEEVKLLRQSPGGVGHGRNDLAAGPDGMIYSIHGDSVDLPSERVHSRTSPFRAANRPTRPSEGFLLRTDRDGTEWEVVAAGLRNPFGIDFHPTDGEPFTYDADAEHDMGSPWYRPTRILHLVSGGDYGWRGVTGSWPPYFPDRADNALPSIDIGKGSPTAVKFGHRSGFPSAYRNALFVLDWAYGRVLAVHLVPRGAGYTASAERFLSGRPLNVTDLDFGPDGAMYLITGGRKTESSLYRVHFAGRPESRASSGRHQTERDAYSRELRQVRPRIEAFHGRQDDDAISAAWPYLNHPGPILRYAARTALEHQPIESWKERALRERRPRASLNALLAVSRSGDRRHIESILDRMTDLTSLGPADLAVALQIYSLCLTEPALLRPETRRNCERQLLELFEALATAPAVTLPTGLSESADFETARLLKQLGSFQTVDACISRLRAATEQEDRLQWLFLLRDVESGWTDETRRNYFEALAEADRFVGGRGMPGFLQSIREESIKTLSEEESRLLKALIEPEPVEPTPTDPVPMRAFVKEWTLDDLTVDLQDPSRDGDLERGARLFREATCDRCHRLGDAGSSLAPDLTAVGRRFGRRDLLEAILSPSDVIAEPYRNVEVVTRAGRVITGQIVSSGDYRSSILKIAPDPIRPTEVIEIPKSDIELHRASAVSPMPKGLLNTLTRDEIFDLLSFLETGSTHVKRRRAAASE